MLGEYDSCSSNNNYTNNDSRNEKIEKWMCEWITTFVKYISGRDSKDDEDSKLILLVKLMIMIKTKIK